MSYPGYADAKNAALRDYCLDIFRDICNQGGFTPEDTQKHLDQAYVWHDEETCYEIGFGSAVIAAYDMTQTADAFHTRGRIIRRNNVMHPGLGYQLEEEGTEGNIGHYIFIIPEES